MPEAPVEESGEAVRTGRTSVPGPNTPDRRGFLFLVGQTDRLLGRIIHP